MTLLINLHGGPGAGKSTTAAELFAALKKRNVNAELCQEYVKQWSWEKRQPVSCDQWYFFGKQARKEYTLFNKVDAIVTDSPVAVCSYYAHHFGDKAQSTLFIDMLKQYRRMAEDQGVEFLDIYLERLKAYNPAGRYQTEEQARAIDKDQESYLGMVGIPLVNVKGDETAVDSILGLLEFTHV